MGWPPFYWSAAGLGLALVFMAFLAVRCRSDARIPLLGGHFSPLPTPLYLPGPCRPRADYYFSSPFFFAAAVLAVAPWKFRAGKIGLLGRLLGLHACWAWQRADLYQGAYRESQAIWRRHRGRCPPRRPHASGRGQLARLLRPAGPDVEPQHGRYGLPAFHRELIRVNTPGCPFAWPPSGIPELSRERILRVTGRATYARSAMRRKATGGASRSSAGTREPAAERAAARTPTMTGGDRRLAEASRRNNLRPPVRTCFTAPST